MLLSELKEETKIQQSSIKVVEGEVVDDTVLPDESKDVDTDEWDLLLEAMDLLSDINKYLNLLIRPEPGRRITQTMQGEMAALASAIEMLLSDSEIFFTETDLAEDGGEV